MLVYLNIDFENKTYDEVAEWEKEKDSLGLSFPQLPYFIDETDENDARISSVLAIIKYLAATHQPSLLGETPEEQGMVENYAHILQEFNKHA